MPGVGLWRATSAMCLVASLSTLAACATSDPPSAVVVEDRELVGMWKGPVRGPYGGSVLTLRLRADSTLAADNENPRYSHFDGVWTVRGGRFIAAGTPEEGVEVTLVAVAPFVRLAGKWTSNASTGTFDLAKR
jgi:hypothetical protein